MKVRARVEKFCEVNGKDLFDDMLAGQFDKQTWRAWEDVVLLFKEAVQGNADRVRFFESYLEKLQDQAALDGCELGLRLGGAE